MSNVTWYPVTRFSADKNLLPLLNVLNKQGILSQVTEEEGQQQLWINNKHKIPEIENYAAGWLSGDIVLADNTQSKSRNTIISNTYLTVLGLFCQSPLTLICIGLSLIGAVLVFGDPIEAYYVSEFLFQPIEKGYFVPATTGLEQGQIWRLVTPIFLHFGPLHFLLNVTFLWVIARRIEMIKGTLHFSLFITIVAIISNTVQYLTHPNIVFGGLSVVLYGALGYIIVYQQYIPDTGLRLHKSIILLFVIYLVLAVLDVLELFLGSVIASRVHVVSLLTGTFLGWMIALIDHRKARGEKPNDF